MRTNYAGSSEVTGIDVKTGRYRTHLNLSGGGYYADEAIMFLHGSAPWTNAWSDWRLALPELGEVYECFAPDLIGYGNSEHPEDPPRGAAAWLEVWIQQLIGLLDAFELPRVNLVGTSVGGALVLHLLHRLPERVDRAVRCAGDDGNAVRDNTPIG